MRADRIVVLIALLVGCAFAQTGPPEILNVVDAATYEMPLGAAAAHSLITIFGRNLARETVAAKPPYPDSLAGTSVSFDSNPYNGRRLRLLYVSPSQINVLVPSLNSNSYRLTVTTPAGSASTTIPTIYGGSNPRIFPQRGGGCGPGLVFNVLPNGAWELNSPSNPAQPGSYVTVLANGTGTAYGLVDAFESGEPGPDDPARRLSAGVIRFGRRFGLFNFAGKMPGTVGVDQLNYRVPEGVQGCSVPLRVVVGYYSEYLGGVQSQPVPVAISRTPRQCVDPPPESSGVLRLTRVRTSGIEPSTTRDEIYAEFIRERDRRLEDENRPDSAYRDTGVGPAGWFRFTGPNCPGFEEWQGEALDPGVLTLSREGGTTVSLTPVQNQDGNWGYTARLPQGFLDDGTVRIRGEGGTGVGAFETEVTFPELRFLTNLAPGTVFPYRNYFPIEWTGGDPEDTLTLNWYRGRDLAEPQYSSVFRTKVKVAEGKAAWFFQRPLSPPANNPFELLVTIERAEPGSRTFTAGGLTLGGRVERRMIYRFGGLISGQYLQ